ncbi:MAG: hypothetical protein AB1512_16420 [Thermodesulfobacteriota bacterium]
MGWIADLLQEIPSAARYKIQLEQMATENAELKAKVATLEASLLEADKVIRQQNETIKQQSAGSHAEPPLEKGKVEILLFLSRQRGTVTADEVARHLRINPQIALQHLTEMNRDRIMVLRSGRVNAPPLWRLADDGRKYLIDNKLIS